MRLLFQPLRRSFASPQRKLTILGLQQGERHSELKLDPAAGAVTRSRTPKRGLFDPHRITSIMNYARSTLLPNGYPNSVRPGYVPFLLHVVGTSCSNCTMNFMNTQALFMALGGYQSCSSNLRFRQNPGVAMGASAALTWVLKDGIGLFVGVSSARKIGEWLSIDIKKWRLIAFWSLGLAYTMDLVTLQFPALFLILAGASNSIKSMSYIAAAGSNAYINQHFALKNNLADIAGKCSAQNTLGTALGYFIGICLTTFINVTSIKMLFPVIVVGTTFNVATTYYAMSKIDISYLNEQRLKIVVENYLSTGRVLTPTELIKHEHFFLRGHRVSVGKLSLADALDGLDAKSLANLLSTYETRPFLCVSREEKQSWLGKLVKRKNEKRVHLYFRKDATIDDVMHGYLCAAAMMKAGTLDGKLLSEGSRREFLEKVAASGWKSDYIYVPYEKHQYELDYR